MEDFFVLSILDLQLDGSKHQAVDKREVIAYVMVGEKCIDCLVLGSPNSSLQKSGQNNAIGQDAGGAASLEQIANEQNDSERGSTHEAELQERLQREKERNIERIKDYNKNTKVPLVGYSLGSHADGQAQPKTVQIILRRVGVEKERFGSVSFSLKRFLKSSGKSYFHWVTLYDSLDDDLFEGDLGIDDDMDFPRVLLEYQVVSSQFTSLINKADKLARDAQEFHDSQPFGRNYKRNEADSANNSQISS